MLRVKISQFIKNNKDKIRDLGIKLMMVAIIVLIATIMLSFNSNYENSKTEEKNAYRPTETVIEGSEIDEEQYETDKNIVDAFLSYCNKAELEEAYKLLSDDCKKELYPTISDFEEYFYNNIFDKERQVNLQAWISTQKYTVYKMRYTNNMLSTGVYDSGDVFQDYVTLSKKADKEEISIGNLVYCEDCNIVTKTKELEATVIRKKIYVSDEEYEIKIKNKTNKTILLDDLNDNRTIRLIAGSDVEYGAYTNKIFSINLRLAPDETKVITIRFKKGLSSDNESKEIVFSNIIRNYYVYKENQENYSDITSISIDVED